MSDEVNNPKVAILLASFNGEKYIVKQLESIKEQSYSNFVCYIHDDGSTDSTQDLIREFCKQDPVRFQYVDGLPCGGAKYNFFFLLRKIADEPYIMFCDQDDYWFPEKIRISVKTIKQLERDTAEPLCIYSDLEVVNSNLKTIDLSFYHFTGKNPIKNDLKSLLMDNVVVGCTMMMNRLLMQKAMELENVDSIYMHDWWIALVAAAYGRLYYINKPLLKYRQHGDNSVGAVPKKTIIKYIICAFNREKWISCRKKIKRSIQYSKLLDKLMNEKNEYKHLIHNMSQIEQRNWFFKICFFLKNGLIPLKKIWQVFCL